MAALTVFGAVGSGSIPVEATLTLLGTAAILCG